MLSNGFKKMKGSLGIGFEIRDGVFQARCDRNLTSLVSDPIERTLINEELIQFILFKQIKFLEIKGR